MENETNPSAPSASSAPSEASSISLVVTACVVGVLFIFLVYSRNFIFGSTAGNWIYPYFEPRVPFSAWVPVVVLVSLALSVFAGSRFIHSHEKITLIACYLNAVLIQTLIHKIYPVALGTIVQSDQANSFYAPAMRYSALDILTRFNQLLPSLPLHARSNLPGKILLFEFLKVFTQSPRMMGFLVIALSSLGALLLYGICKQLFHDKQTALYALILYSVLACKLFFLPLLNTVTPVIILLCLYLFLAYIETRRILFAWLLGIGLYLQIFFEPIPLVTGIIFLGILLLAIHEKRVSGTDAWKMILNLGLGFLAVYILFSVLFSFHLFPALTYAVKDAAAFNAHAGRDYWIWLGEDVKEFFFAVGVPISVITIYMTAQIATQWKASKDFALLTVENVYLISLIITFAVLVLLGVNRGEITRLWIFLAVLFQVPASIFMAKNIKSSVPFFLVASTLVGLSMIALHRVGFIIP